jgi:hypothetical protein
MCKKDFIKPIAIYYGNTTTRACSRRFTGAAVLSYDQLAGDVCCLTLRRHLAHVVSLDILERLSLPTGAAMHVQVSRTTHTEDSLAE